MEGKLLYTITCTSKATGKNDPIFDGSAVERICDTLEEAQYLLEDLYKRTSRHASGCTDSRDAFIYYNPEWVPTHHEEDHPHMRLKVQMKCANPYIPMSEECIYEIHEEWEHNLFSKRRWLI